MASEYKNKFPVFWFMIIFAIVIDFGIVWFLNRNNGWTWTLIWFFITLIILGILGLIVGAVIWLFMPHRRSNLVFMKNQIIKAANYGARGGEQLLYFQGSDGLSTRQIGYIQGVCAVKSEPKQEIIDDKDGKKLLIGDESEQKLQPVEGGHSKTVFYITFSRSRPGFLSSIFSSPDVCAVFEEDIYGKTEGLNWDIVRLKDSAFTIPIGQIYYLKKHFKATEVADEVTTKIIYRYQLMDNLDQLKSITDAFLNLNPKFRAEQEASNLQVVSGQTTSTGQTQASGG